MVSVQLWELRCHRIHFGFSKLLENTFQSMFCYPQLWVEAVVATPPRLAMVIAAKTPSDISYLLLLLPRAGSLTCKQPKIFHSNIKGHFRLCLQQQVLFSKVLSCLCIGTLFQKYYRLFKTQSIKISNYSLIHISIISLFRFTSFGPGI